MSFAQTCIVRCTDNDRVIDAEVIDFRQGLLLTVSLTWSTPPYGVTCAQAQPMIMVKYPYTMHYVHVG